MFSYLPKDRDTLWFMEEQNLQSISPLRFILRNPPLRYAGIYFSRVSCIHHIPC